MILNQAPKPETTPEPKTPEPALKEPEAKAPEAKPTEEKSLINGDKKDEPAGAPEKYEPFTLPEGATLDEKTMTSAQEVFKELGLPQATAQKLVDFHIAQTKAITDQINTTVRDTREGWRSEILKNPDLGNGTTLRPEVSARIGRTIDMLPNAEAFRQAMDLTGTGDNPEFVKAFDYFARQLAEGSSVRGGKPSAEGQKNPSAPAKSAASALYPNLPSSTG